MFTGSRLFCTSMRIRRVKMDKDIYERTELEIIEFKYDDVITTSNEEDEVSERVY